MSLYDARTVTNAQAEFMRMSPIVKRVSNSTSERAREARTELMGRIAQFVLRHEIDITGQNLAVIAEALMGSKAELSKTVAAREISGEPINQQWLDCLARQGQGARKDRADSRRMQALEELMDRMEGQLLRFSDVAKNAQDESTEHRGAIDEQIEIMSQREVEGSLLRAELDRVIEISQTMVERMSQVELAMERSQAETMRLRNSLAKARVEADIDHLTRLPNRRAFERRFEEAERQLDANGEAFSVAICDIDNFKAVNDTHGHKAGDRVLVAVSTMLSSHASADCFVARHGGEEFVLIFAGADKDEAWRKLDGIRRVQAAKRMVNRDNGKGFGRITFSGGIAEVAKTGDAETALTRADAALYRAKEEGRNRIVAV